MTGAKRSPAQPADVRRYQIVGAVLGIIAEKGLDQLTTAEVARRLGIAEATIFKHFGSKGEMLREAVRVFTKALLGKIEGTVAADLPAAEKLVLLLRLHFQTLREQGGIPRLIFGEQLHLKDEIVRHTMRETIRRYKEMVAAVLKQGVGEGTFRQNLDCDAAATLYVGLVQVTVFHWLLENKALPAEEEIDRLGGFLVECFGAPQIPA